MVLFSKFIFIQLVKQQEFGMKSGKVVVCSIPIFLVITIQVIANFIFSHSIQTNPLLLVWINLFGLLLNVPGVLLFFNYYHYSKNKTVILTYDKIILSENGIVLKELLNSNIHKIERVGARRYSRFPWQFFDYFILEDSSGNQIIIPCFMMELVQLRTSTLARKIPSGNYIETSRFFPRIPE